MSQNFFKSAAITRAVAHANVEGHVIRHRYPAMAGRKPYFSRLSCMLLLFASLRNAFAVS